MRILTIAYFYPPAQTIGVVRLAKLTKYWTRAGADVMVVKSRDYVAGANPANRSLEQEVAHVATSIADVPLPLHAISSPRALVTRVERAVSRPRQHSNASSPTAANARVRTSVERVARRIRDHVLLPDFGILWSCAALQESISLHAQKPFDIVFATGNPWSNLITASRVAKRLGLPLAIDFRDPWGDGTIFDGLAGWTSYERRIHRALEARVCRRASVITTTTAPIANQILERCHPPTPPQVVENGYDAEESEGIVGESDPNVFRVVMTSSFRAGDRFRAFAQALRRCVDSGAFGDRRVVFSFAGKPRTRADLPPIGEYFREVGLEDCLDARGFVPRREALRLQRSADLLLFIEDRFESVGGGMVGTEFYEYMGTGQRVLLVDDETSAVWHAGKGARSVRRCEHDDVSAMEVAIADAVFGRWTANPDWDWIGQFSRKSQASRLLAMLEVAVANHKS